MATMVADWADGEPDALAKQMNDSLKDSPEVAKVLLTDRNARWAEWVEGADGAAGNGVRRGRRRASGGRAERAGGAGAWRGEGAAGAVLARLHFTPSSATRPRFRAWSSLEAWREHGHRHFGDYQ